jgi:hypothetical protein
MEYSNVGTTAGVSSGVGGMVVGSGVGVGDGVAGCTGGGEPVQPASTTHPVRIRVMRIKFVFPFILVDILSAEMKALS